MVETVDSLKEPPIVGNYYLVPCKIEYTEQIREDVDYDEQMVWMDLEEIEVNYPKKIVFITPIINHPHSDRENGQKEIHYHLDTRFKIDKYCIPYVNSISGTDVRPIVNFTIKYINLQCVDNKFGLITPVSLISKSNLKHKCIHKGKCPHRGMDLSQVVPDEEGNITCPLHGLIFNKNKQLINGGRN